MLLMLKLRFFIYAVIKYLVGTYFVLFHMVEKQ